MVREFDDHVTLLVAGPVTVLFYKKLGIRISHKMLNLECFKSPESEPIQDLDAPQLGPLSCPRESVLCDAPLWNELMDQSMYPSKWSLSSLESTVNGSIEMAMNEDPDVEVTPLQVFIFTLLTFIIVQSSFTIAPFHKSYNDVSLKALV